MTDERKTDRVWRTAEGTWLIDLDEIFSISTTRNYVVLRLKSRENPVEVPFHDGRGLVEAWTAYTNSKASQ